MNVLLLIPTNYNITGSQRFRFEHYIQLPEAREINFVPKPFFSTKAWSYLHLSGHVPQKVWGIMLGFIKRFFTLFTLFKYDFVFIHREAAPIGPPVFEWLIAKVFRKKIIYDFDDAIWVSIASKSNPKAALVKCTWKVANICSYSYIVTVGNDFLADYARQYCKDVRIIPTVVNTETVHNIIKDQADMPLVVGWTGTFTNFIYLQQVVSAIAELKKKYDFTFLIIADKDPMYTEVEYTFKKWRFDTEIPDLVQMNIGIMPLANTGILQLGKCAFKAIQYMSLGIPAVVSPVGANCAVVDDGVDGFWAEGQQGWYEKLELLIKDKALRLEMGQKSRAHIVRDYSVVATKKAFFDLFKK